MSSRILSSPKARSLHTLKMGTPTFGGSIGDQKEIGLKRSQRAALLLNVLPQPPIEIDLGGLQHRDQSLIVGDGQMSEVLQV